MVRGGGGGGGVGRVQVESLDRILAIYFSVPSAPLRYENVDPGLHLISVQSASAATALLSINAQSRRGGGLEN